MTTQTQYAELRLMIEELCCDLCRFEHVVRGGLRPTDVAVDREYYLGSPGSYADIRVSPAGLPAYTVEVKHGYPTEMLLRRLANKYKVPTPATDGLSGVTLVIDLAGRADRDRFLADARAAVPAGLALDVWDEDRLLGMIREHFGVELTALTPDQLIEARRAIMRAKGARAFGTSIRVGYPDDALRTQLLWHFGPWRLEELRARVAPGGGELNPRDVLPPGRYADVIVLLADMCSFSSFVRDTPDADLVRACLTAFYSKSRYQLLNGGGMLNQFVGDEVLGFFGVPDRRPGYAAAALDTAKALVNIGASVAEQWQRRIDRLQVAKGLHIGMAVGEIQIVSLQPFGRTHMGAIGDCLNVAARLMTAAGPGEIVVSNQLYNGLPEEMQAGFAQLEPVEAKNVGRIVAWKLHPAAG